VAGDDLRQTVCSLLPVVVLHDLVELVLLGELVLCDSQPVVDRARRFRVAVAEPALQLVDGRGDENRDRPFDAALYPERTLGLELEQWRPSLRAEPIDLRIERPVSVADVVDPLEKLARLDPALELLLREEVVMHPVLLPGTPLARRRGYGRRELRETRPDELNQRPLTGATRAGDDEDRLLTC